MHGIANLVTFGHDKARETNVNRYGKKGKGGALTMTNVAKLFMVTRVFHNFPSISWKFICVSIGENGFL